MFYIKKFIQSNKILLILFGLALFLRFLGITQGDPYVFSIDEPTVIRTTLSLRFNPFIDHFDWPHFNYYFNYLFYFVFIKFRALLQLAGLKPSIEGFLPVLWNDPFIFYVISRIIVGIIGALTVFPIYYLGVEIFKNKKAALFSAFFISVIPFHVYFSHYALQDESMLFWLSLAIYFGYIGILHNKARSYLLSGLFFGLAVGTKYNAILFMAMIPAFAIEKYIGDKKDFVLMFRNSIWLGLIAGITFVVTSYSLIFKWSTFWSYEYGKGILWQLKYNVVAVKSSKYINSLINNIFDFNHDLSTFGVVIILIGIFFIIKKKKDIGTISMLIVSVTYFLYVSRFARSPSHYYLPIYVFLPIFAGYAYLYIKEKYRVLLIIGILGMFVVSFWSSIKFTKINTKTEAVLEYNESYKGRLYYRGEGFSSMNLINNLGIMKYQEIDVLTSNNILISETEIKDDRLKQVDYISSKNRYGGPVYVYTGNE